MNLADTLARYFIDHGHYGLIRNESESAFKTANPFTLNDEQLPPVDVASIPTSMGVSDWMTIENQGQVGSCQGHARTSACELAIYRETKAKPPQLNRMYAYLTSQKVDGIRGDMGSTIDGGAKASQEYGDCLESLWPYSGRYTAFSSIPQACFADGRLRTLRTFQTLRSYEQVLRWLVHGMGGIVIGIGWNRTCEPDNDGKITSYRSGGVGHALALLDWNKAYADSKSNPFIEMYNSWGKGWGNSGIAYVHPNIIDQWCEDETVIGYSDMDGTAIHARPFDLAGGL